MNKLKQLGFVSLATLMLSTATLPALANAQVKSNLNLETRHIHSKSIEQELRQVDYNALFRTVSAQLGLNEAQHASGEVNAMGWKTKVAKEVAQKLITQLKNVGSRAWDETIKDYVNKLPLTKGAKDNLKYYLSYQVLMEALNIMVDFQGTAEDGLSNALEDIGVPGWLAGAAARAIVFFLL